MHSATVFGSVVLDIIMEIPSHYLISHGQGDAIKLPYGAKLATKNYHVTVGGSGANVAVGLKKAGIDATLRTSLSNGTLAQLIKKELEKTGVPVLESTVEQPTAVSIVLRAKGDRTIITGSSQTAKFLNIEIPQDGWLHLGPLPDKMDEFLQKVITHRLNTNQGLSINPSMIQIEERSRVFLSLLRTTDLIFLNLQEALRLTRLPARTQIEDVTRSLHALGVAVVCITDGERGAYASNQNHIWFAEATCDEVCRLDATGAGDGFSSGFIAGYIDGPESEVNDDICEKSLKMAMLDSGAVVGGIGAQAGLLTRAEIERDLGTVKIKLIR
ncbi:MAG: carbohydrate kinase family protein [Patescibacteria group bacterium]